MLDSSAARHFNICGKMSAVGSRHNKITAGGTKKSRKAVKGSKAGRTKSPSPVSKVVRESDAPLDGEQVLKGPAPRKAFRTVKASAEILQKTSAALLESPGIQETDRAIQSLELALKKGADRSVVDGLAKALVARASSAEAVALVEELAALLCESNEPTFFLGLAKDLENGADPDLIGSLAAYLKSGVPPAKIAALAWFFPRELLIRPRRQPRANAA